MNERKPYIGVTGATKKKEVDHLLETIAFAGISKETNHIPMIGFLVSQKTLFDQGWSVFSSNLRYPLALSLPNLLRRSVDFAFNTVHYNTQDKTTLKEQIEVLLKGLRGEGLCHGIQFNIAWPEVDQLKAIKDKNPDLALIFQLSNKAMKGKSQEELLFLLSIYKNIVSYVLVDPSGGRGVSFAEKEIAPIVSSFQKEFPEITIGVAGGFTGENVEERIKSLTQKLGNNNFSIDAEGGLRDKITKNYGDDIYSREKVEGYIKNAAKTLKI